MPLVRYLLLAGGTLLTLLFLADWYFPKLATATAAAEVDRTVIRIHSSQRWPAAVRIDTSAPIPPAPPVTLVAGEMPAAASEMPAPAPAPAPANSPRLAYAFDPPAKSSDRTQRRARPVTRAWVREPRRRLASTQPNWFPAW